MAITFFRASCILLSGALVPAVARAADWWVAPDGSDGGAGTMDDPWATILQADAVVAPGDVVHVLPGDYSCTFETTASGSEGARIVFASEPKWGARLICDGGGWIARGDWVDIVGFELSGDAAVGMLAMGSHVRYFENWVHDLAPACDGNGGAGIDAGNYDAQDVDMIGNVVHDIWVDDIDGTPCNRVQGLYHAIAFGTIANNLVWNVSGWGIHTWHAPSDLVITSNLVFGSGGGGILVGAGDSPGDGFADRFFVANNIVVYNAVGILEYGATGLDNRYVNNLVHENPGGHVILQNGLVDEGTIVADPLFVDWRAGGGGDYHLADGSPAIDAGTPEHAPASDHDGVSRPQGGGFDIGPYELAVDESTGGSEGDAGSTDGAGDSGSDDANEAGPDGASASDSVADGSTGGGGADNSTTAAADDGNGGSSGCACAAADRPAGSPALALALAVARRRRRPHAMRDPAQGHIVGGLPKRSRSTRAQSGQAIARC
jgi:MYXO-CTERM domain-containing protein